MKTSHTKSLLLLCTVTVFCLMLYSDRMRSNGIVSDKNGLWFRSSGSNASIQSVKPLAKVKTGNKWIVVTSVSSPTDDVKRLASIKDWNLVVVADTKTPLNWTLEGVHFLSVDYQETLRKGFDKRIKLGLDQFDYDESVSGIRYRGPDDNGTEIDERLFNPYRYFGMKNMWPRGFPLEHFEEHTNGNDSQVLCQKMKRAAVQQGLVHHDPDVDAVYRLLNADPETGLNVKFNKFTPPITLSVGTYSPWNSQNTLFHKSAFHTLFLPTTVSFRTTDIWRSFIAQKVLHLSGLTVSFVPTNAVQFRNAHDYLKDFKDEKQVYEDSGKMIKYLHNWKCGFDNLKECMMQMANDLVDEELWKHEDSKLIVQFLEDLEGLGFEFPLLVGPQIVDPYKPSFDEKTRDVNCRRMSLEFELLDPKQEGTEESQNVRRAVQKLNYFGDIVNWCNASGYSKLENSFPSPEELAENHNKSHVLRNELNTVLVVVNNFPWKYGMGLIQRLYQPYFASVIFCGSWYPEQIKSADNYTSTVSPFNYIHMNPEEMHSGFFAYHCITLAKEMRLSNVEGYFLMADDSFFNIWQQVDYKRVHHLMGATYPKETLWWQNPEYGISKGKQIVKEMEKTEDLKRKDTWKQFENGLKKYGYIMENQTAEKDMTSGLGRSISDFFYIPTNQIEYYGNLMRIFYENQLFLELAVNRFLRSVNHQTSAAGISSYLWGGDRSKYMKLYNPNMVAMHPVKVSAFREPNQRRKDYCGSIIQTWADILFQRSHNFTIKGDNDPDYLNG